MDDKDEIAYANEIAYAMSIATGKDVKYDDAKYAYVVVEGGEEVVAGYADEDVVEIVGTLLRM